MSRICHLFTGEAVRTELDWSLAMMGIAYWTFQCDGSRWAGTDASRQCQSVPTGLQRRVWRITSTVFLPRLANHQRR
jgi:hypothetical protein